MGWLKVTNFAIDCHFLDVALTAKDFEDLKTCFSNDHFYGIACLYDDSRPELERPKLVSEETMRKEYWEHIHGMLPALYTALHIVRDIFWFYDTRYDPKKETFSVQKEFKLGPQLHIAEAVFDYPDFKPFRYAYIIITKTLVPYQTEPRRADGGELPYSLKFKIIEESASPVERRLYNLRNYVLSPLIVATRESI